MHKLIRDSNLELLASKVGLSSTTLANHLTYNTSKTATEVVSETDTTDVTVANKRELAERAINALISDVLRFYFIVGEVDITWNTNGQNSQRNKDAILAEFNAQLMPRVEAIKRLHPELTQAEVEEWDKQLAQQNSIDDIFDTSKRFI
jgi:AraC-like DNA-binding protein